MLVASYRRRRCARGEFKEFKEFRSSGVQEFRSSGASKIAEGLKVNNIP
jgi:hypothetical protein